MPTHTVEGWLRAALEEAERRELPELKPLLDTLARSTVKLRAADAEAREEDAGPQPDAGETR